MATPRVRCSGCEKNGNKPDDKTHAGHAWHGLYHSVPGGARFKRVKGLNPPGSGKDTVKGKGDCREAGFEGLRKREEPSGYYVLSEAYECIQSAYIERAAYRRIRTVR